LISSKLYLERRVILYSIYEKARIEKGISNYRVSVDTGVPQSSLSRWKKGVATPKVDKLIKIAKYLGIPLSKLIESNRG